MSLNKNHLLVGTIFVIAMIVFVFLLFGPKNEKYYIKCMIKILNQYGIETEAYPVERVLVSIPSEFDDVYENYNALQREAGFDLKKYSGKNVWRYSYRVTNMGTTQEIRANLLVYQDKVIGGDVMSTSIGGFMVPLNFRELKLDEQMDLVPPPGSEPS